MRKRRRDRDAVFLSSCIHASVSASEVVGVGACLR